jgi:hypothetical protein
VGLQGRYNVNIGLESGPDCPDIFIHPNRAHAQHERAAWVLLSLCKCYSLQTERNTFGVPEEVDEKGGYKIYTGERRRICWEEDME